MREPLPSDAEPTTAAPDAHVEAVRNEHRSELADALAALPAQQREAVLLRDVRGFSYEEVAASLAVSTSAVESLLFRARSRLRAQLRTAYAAISGAGWIGPLRELLGTGGLAGAPVAAKAVAVGALGAVVAGGVVAPTMLEHRGPAAPPPARSTARTHVVPQAAQAPPASAPPVVFAPATLARPSIEDVSSVAHRSIAGGEGEHSAAAGDGAGAESQSGDGSASDRQGGGTQGSGGGEVSGGETGGGESGKSTGTSTSSSSAHSGRTETDTAPTLTLSTHSESSGDSGDSSGQSSGQPSVQSDSSGSGDSGGGDGSDG